MKIKTKLFASHLIMAAVVSLIAAVFITVLRTGETNQRELSTSYEQIRAINFIAAWANDYSEQVAELFILGTDTTEIIEARDGLLDALARKEDLLLAEMRQHPNDGAPRPEHPELNRIDAMREMVLELDHVRKEVEVLLSDGHQADAEVIYRNQIEHRLDSVLGDLIDSATVNERAEVNAAIASSAQLSDRMRFLAFALVGTAALLALGNALMLHRGISRPISALSEGADAVGRGDLSHTVDVSSRDELGALAERFNVMTSQLRDQRDRLLHANDLLEKQVAERTRELSERSEQVEHANRRLRDIDANRAQFFADISHELRTPLTILRGHAEVTLRAPDSSNERLRQSLTQVVRKADQIGRLVEDLLFLARSEAGTITVETEPVDLQEVFADVLLDCHGLRRRPGVTISPQQAVLEPVMVTGDPGRLRQAIMIPVDNAIRVAPAGSVVSLDLGVVDRWVRIAVIDQGPGFTPDEAKQAFSRFYSGRRTRGRSDSGTGLGLAIAHWIINQHNGRISVHSTPGHGAEIRIDLPLSAEPK
ncbi:sensor histidine kinase [Qingshengfaniella alkalisoli]|nr:ATP-binding protein [Qingshengfaniella alkalisoli]